MEGQKVALRVSCEQSRCSTVQRRRGGGGRTERSARSPRRSCSLSASNCPPCSARLLPVLRARLFSPVPSPSTPAFLPPSEPRSCGTKLTARPSPRPPPRRASISHLARLQGPPRVVVDPGPGPEGVGPHRRPPRQLAHLQDRHRHPHRRDLGRRHLERALCPQRGGRHPRLVRHLPRLRLEPRPRALPRVGRRPDPGPSPLPSLCGAGGAQEQTADYLRVAHFPIPDEQKVKDILNSSRASHTKAVGARIESVQELKEVEQLTKQLFELSKVRILSFCVEGPRRTVS